MNAKGITWIGNIYQKFEAMCLEVEEIMYQDTAKFVEDQVENVGASVQKFYSEVMQDLDRPSSLDPGKVTGPEITMDKWDDGKTYKRPTTCVKRLSEKTGPNQFPKGSDALGVVKKDGVHASSVKRFNKHQKPSSNSTRDALLTSKEGKAESRFLTAAETQPPSEASWMVPASERTETHSSQVLSRNTRTIKHQDTIVSSVDVEMARGFPIKASIDGNGQQNGSVNDSLPNIPPININIVDECIKNDGRKTTISSSLVDSEEGTSFRNAVMPVTASSDAIEASYFKIPVNTDGADIGHTSGNSLIEHNLITLDKIDWGNLEESCIFIDVDGHHSISRSRGKQRSYKKTIRDAFSLKKKKAFRGREYEQLAVLYDDALIPKDCSAESWKGGTSDARGSSECGWELL